jgi:choline transporter-like protein 2/4/5
MSEAVPSPPEGPPPSESKPATEEAVPPPPKEAPPAQKKDEKESGPEPVVERVEFDDFKAYKDRSCTDVLCCLLFIVFLLGWVAVVVLGWMFGSPYSIVYAVDYEANICSHSCSKTSDNCPGNLLKRRVGHFPRIVPDMMEQADDVAQGKLPKFYTICRKECPQKGDIVCDYAFEQKYYYKLGIDLARVKQCLAATASVNRFVYAQAPRTLDLALAASSVPDKDLCAEAYLACDFTTTNTKEVFNRCLPVSQKAPENVTERCSYPLSTTACAATDEQAARSGKFTTNCIKSADDGNYYQAAYLPTEKVYDGYVQYLLEGDSKKECASKEVYTESLREEMPQDDQLGPLLETAMTAMSYFADVVKSWRVILVMGLVAPLVLSSVWVGILRFCTGLVVWGTLVLLELTLLGGGVFALIQAEVIDVNAVSSQVSASAGTEVSVEVPKVDTPYNGYFEAIGYVLCACAGILLCLMVFKRSAIKTAVNVIKLACAAIGSMPQLQFFPILTYIALAGLLGFWVIVQLLLVTASDISTDDIMSAAGNATDLLGMDSSAMDNATAVNFTATTGVAALDDMKTINYLYAYHLFGLLWANAFIQGLGMMTISGAVSCWYWAPFENTTKDTDGDGNIGENDKTTSKVVVPGWPVFGSLCRTMRFHVGSVAFGSLIIAIVQFIRIVFAYITKQLEGVGGEDSKIKKVILCIINCMLACLEKCVKYISRNSYIYTSIKGTSFCWSAFMSFKLIFNNLARFGMTAGITAVLMLLAKTTVVAGSAVLGYIWLKYDPTYNSGELQVTNPVLPLVLMVIMSLIVALSFFYVVELGIDTVLLNYCIDLERKDQGKPMAADYKLGKAPLGPGKDGDGGEKDDGDMDVSCCSLCKCCNPFVRRCCVDEKKGSGKVAPSK